VIAGSPIRADLDPDNSGRLRQVALNLPTNYPEPGGLTGLTQGALQAIGLSQKETLPKSASQFVFDKPTGDRVYRVLEQLRILRLERTLLTVSSTRAYQTNMAIKSIRMARKHEDGDTATIVLDLEQITYVQSETADAVPLPLEPRGQKKTGKNAAASGAPVPEGEKKSAAKRLAELVGL
jgi:hypothetical protein